MCRAHHGEAAKAFSGGATFTGDAVPVHSSHCEAGFVGTCFISDPTKITSEYLNTTDVLSPWHFFFQFHNI